LESARFPKYLFSTLMELDLHLTEGRSKVMSSLFNTNETYWGHSNADEKASNAYFEEFYRLVIGSPLNFTKTDFQPRK
jgi:hypothetical protein